MNERVIESEGAVVGLEIESGTVALLNRSEVDAQIATAQKYPRSIKKFLSEAMDLATLNENIAAACTYAIPRDGKTVEGPSARFAEIVLSAWGNCRSGARIVDIGSQFITAQGVCHDLQRNVAITFEVQRRITTKHGKRFSDDMIVTTGNAACSIALRNSILKVIPMAFWADVWEAARKTVRGDIKTLANRREEALKHLQGFGITKEKVFAALGVQGVADITLDHLVTLRGIATAIRDGDVTPEDAFGAPKITASAPPEPPMDDVNPATKAKPAAKPAEPEKAKAPDQPKPAAVEAIRAEFEAMAKSAPNFAVLDEAWNSIVMATQEAGKLSEADIENVFASIYDKHRDRIEFDDGSMGD